MKIKCPTSIDLAAHLFEHCMPVSFISDSDRSDPRFRGRRNWWSGFVANPLSAGSGICSRVLPSKAGIDPAMNSTKLIPAPGRFWQVRRRKPADVERRHSYLSPCPCPDRQGLILDMKSMVSCVFWKTTSARWKRVRADVVLRAATERGENALPSSPTLSADHPMGIAMHPELGTGDAVRCSADHHRDLFDRSAGMASSNPSENLEDRCA